MAGKLRAQLCALTLAVAGCAAPSQSLRKENTVLAHEVDALRAERRSSDRKLRELRAEMLYERERGVPARTPSDGTASRHELRPAAAPIATDDSITISNVAPDERVIDVLQDGTEIVYAGDAAKGTPVTLSGDAMAPAPRGTAVVAIDTPKAAKLPTAPAIKPVAPAPALAPAPIVAPAPSVASTASIAPVASMEAAPHPLVANWPKDPVVLYQTALDALKQGHHDVAVEGLTVLIAKHPSHEYADNAQYWIGEAYYDRRQFGPALTAFQTTIARYPKGNKSADATLKAGLCLVSLGQAARAGEYLRRVISLYPTSDSAAIASDRLRKLVTGAAPSASSSSASPLGTSVRSP